MPESTVNVDFLLNVQFYQPHAKDSLLKYLKILLDTDLKINLLSRQNNSVIIA